MYFSVMNVGVQKENANNRDEAFELAWQKFRGLGIESVAVKKRVCMILFNWVFNLGYLVFAFMTGVMVFGVIQGNSYIPQMLILGIIAFIFKKLADATDSISKEKVWGKINELNRGILNSNAVPSHFTASQCNDMAFLCMEVSGYEHELNQNPNKKS